MRARSLSEIRDRYLPGKISAGIPDSLAPELLTSEFLKFKLFSPKSSGSRIFRRSRGILLPQPASPTNL